MQESDRLNTLKSRIKQIETQIDEKSKILSSLRTNSARTKIDNPHKFVRVMNQNSNIIKSQQLPSLKQTIGGKKLNIRAASEDKLDNESADIIIKLRNENGKLNTKIETLNSTLKSKNDEISKLKSENAALQHKLELSASINKQGEQKEAELMKKIDSLINDLDELKISKLETKMEVNVLDEDNFDEEQNGNEVEYQNQPEIQIEEENKQNYQEFENQNEGDQKHQSNSNINQNQFQGESQGNPIEKEKAEIIQGQGDNIELEGEKESKSIPFLLLFESLETQNQYLGKIQEKLEVEFKTQFIEFEDCSDICQSSIYYFTIDPQKMREKKPKIEHLFLVSGATEVPSHIAGLNPILVNPLDHDSLKSFTIILESAGLERRFQQILFFSGPPGCGKGTICKGLIEEYELVPISIGDSLRKVEGELKANLQELMSLGKLIDSSLVVKVLMDGIKKLNTTKFSTILIDGFPRNISNLEAWKEAGLNCEKLFFIDVSKEESKRRILSRNEGRADDNEDSFEKRWSAYMEETIPAINQFAISNSVTKINAEQEISDVVAEVRINFDFVEKREKKPPRKVLMCFGGEMSKFFIQFLCEQDKNFEEISFTDILTNSENNFENALYSFKGKIKETNKNLVISNLGESNLSEIIASLDGSELFGIHFSEVDEEEIKDKLALFENLIKINSDQSLGDIISSLKEKKLLQE